MKPANVLFRSTDDGERAVLSDLGLGKSLDEVSRITMPGGTPSYVAPEQAMGERLDQRADQYSLGAVAYAALTGRSPHQVDGLGAASRVEVAPPPSSLGFDLPDLVDAAIVRALDPDREKRWPDVQSFTRELVGALDETTHDFPLSIRESVTVAVPAGAGGGRRADRPQRCEHADHRQDVVHSGRRLDCRGAAAAVESAAAELAAEGTAESSAGTGTAEAQPETPAPRKRRRGRWVIAAVLALIVGGGAGFEGQRYLAGRELVGVEYGGISLTLPRGWTKSVADSEWQPPGSSKSYPALRVSQDGDWSTRTPGVFVGVTDARDVKLALVSSPQLSCNTLGIPAPSTGDGRTVTDQVSNGCGDGGAMLFQRVVDTGTTGSMLIQVLLPKNDPDRAREIAASVQYNGG